MKIAVDFDGTIVEHQFPKIGKVKPFAFSSLIELQKLGHQLILWTYRSGKELEEALDFCKENGLEFYAVNKNYPEEVYDNSISRKIFADIYIDDRNIGGFPGWSLIWRLIKNNNPLDFNEFVEELSLDAKKDTFSEKIKKLLS
ncbi:MAG: hypothetical protein U0W24_23075 [Bacteroidales bacterium]